MKTAKDRSFNLLAHADTEYRYLSSKVSDGIPTYAGVTYRMTGAGADDELSGIFGDQLFEGDLIVSIYCNCCAFKDEILIYIPGE